MYILRYYNYITCAYLEPGVVKRELLEEKLGATGGEPLEEEPGAVGA